MSVTTENAPVQGQTTLQENRAGEGVYASLFEKLISPRRLASGISTTFWTMPRFRGAGGGTSHRGDAGVYGTHPPVRPAGGKARQNADRSPYRRAGFPDKPSAGRGDAPSGVSAGRIPVARPQTAGGQHRLSAERQNGDPRRRQRRSAPDFEDAPELIQSGMYWHTYTAGMTLPAASRSAR